jgi:hypothetical protein
MLDCRAHFRSVNNAQECSNYANTTYEIVRYHEEAVTYMRET